MLLPSKPIAAMRSLNWPICYCNALPARLPAARDADLRAARDTMEALKTAEVRDYFRDDCITALQSRTVTLDRPPPHTAVLYPILLPNRLELLLSTPDNLQQITRCGLTATPSPAWCASSGARWKSAPAANIFATGATALWLADSAIANHTRCRADRNTGHRPGRAVTHHSAGGAA